MLHLPSAHGCKPDEEPLWSLPVEAGGAGPVADDTGVVIASLAACGKLGPAVALPTAKQVTTGAEPELEDCAGCTAARGDCIVASERLSNLATPRLVAMPRGGVAFNDDGITEHTQVLGPSASWKVETKATGDVAADDDTVYAISHAGDVDPVRVIAFSRDTGKPRWHTDLAGAKSTEHAKIVVRDGYLAARAGDKLFALQLPTKLTRD